MPALLLAAALMSAAPAAPPPAAQAPQSVCESEAAHQFDFLIGTWTVTPPGGGDVLSTMSVTRVADGCGLIETVDPVKGIGSESLMAYDSGATLWRRVSISGDGEMLSLQGGFQDGQMVMEGDQSGPGKPMLVRLTWISNGETVHEDAEHSPDGRIWNPWFSRDLHRVVAPSAAAPVKPSPLPSPS